jgi:hypothetical protein
VGVKGRDLADHNMMITGLYKLKVFTAKACDGSLE